MKLRLNKELFVNYIRITAQQMNISANFVEKDYWVTYVVLVTDYTRWSRTPAGNRNDHN